MAAQKPFVGDFKIQISPTFISSDLFHPAWVKKTQFSKPRSTFWGADITNYGGIGKLPTLGTSLEVKSSSRGHRHFKSGIHCYHYDTNPYVVTDVSLISGQCVNPQTLNDPYLVQDPFTSHISRFEVFPRFDPKRNELDVPSERFLKQEIDPSTKLALDQLSNRIYRQTEYQSNYKHPELNDKNRAGFQNYNPWEYVLIRKTDEQNTNEHQEDDEDDQEADDDTERAQVIQPATAAPSKSEDKRLTESDIKPEDQVNEFEKLKLVDYTKKNPKDFIARHKFALMLPKVTDFGKKKTYDTPRIFSIPKEMQQETMKLPALKDHDIKLIRRQKLPAMVGMKFKSDVHAEYHRDHPESVPDLRDSIAVGKQHRFYGVHASLLR